MNKLKNRGLFFIVFVCVLMIFCGCKKDEKVYLKTEEQAKDTLEEDAGNSGKDEKTGKTIFVYVCGAVENPGVYELEEEKRVCDALQAAGGLTKEAAAEELNQAESLSDGQMIKVLTAEEKEKAQTEVKEAGLLNINTASAEELMQLPGIGQSKADAVIAYREEQGGFKTPEELMNISGIKEGVYNKIKDSITVN